MAATMRAVDIKGGTGPADSLFLNDQTPKPSPGDGEAIVKIKAFGLNRMDLIQREGHYPVPPQAPKTLGVEFSGTIESLGNGDNDSFKQGDQVFGLAYGGAYAEYVAVNTKMLLHKPGHLSFEEAAGIPETWITATQALHIVGEFSAGKSVLWHAGASSVSIAGIQLSQAAGASEIYATAGSKEKCDFVVNKLGATAAFNYREKDWAQEILDATGGRGVDLIVDFVGANYFQQNLNAAARDAHIVLLGVLSGTKVKEVDIGQLLFKRIRIEGSTLRSREVEYQKSLRDKLEEYLPDFERGKFKIIIDKVIPWENIVEAHQTLQASETMGKIICTIS